MGSPFGVGNALFRYSSTEEMVDTVAFGAYRRSIFEKIGLFDEEFVRNQDDELNFRITKSGGKILLSPDIVSHYYTRGSFSKLWRQYFQYGFWKVRVIQKHKRPASLRHLVPMLFVLSLISGAVLSIFFPLFRYLSLLLLLTYTVFASAFAVKASKGTMQHVFSVIWSFVILHISYGLGFLNGIFAFYVTRNKDSVSKNTRMSR
jgi:GT2 family glycosyltransferase